MATKRKPKVKNLRVFVFVSKKIKKRFPKNFRLIRGNQLTSLLIVLGLAGMIRFGNAILASPAVAVPTNYSVKKSDINYSLSKSNAERLLIPSLGVDAEVSTVGTNEDGSLEVPGDAKTVGQYENAPTPGEVGPSVLVGHVDTIYGQGVFWNLNKIEPKSFIEVKREDGTIAKFKVYKIASYSQDNFPTSKIYNNTDSAELRVITCGGWFNAIKGHYTENTVVYAQLDS